MGAMLIFQCDPGYMPREELSSTCLSNSSWYPFPECEGISNCDSSMYIIIVITINAVIDCGAPPDYGFVVESFNDTKLDAVITFHCEESDTALTAICRTDGEWDPNPVVFVCVNGTGIK